MFVLGSYLLSSCSSVMGSSCVCMFVCIRVYKSLFCVSVFSGDRSQYSRKREGLLLERVVGVLNYPNTRLSSVKTLSKKKCFDKGVNSFYVTL